MQDGVSQLMTAIEAMAEAEKTEIRALAEKEIAKINERTETQITQFRDEAFAKLEDQLRNESECIVGRADLEIRDRIIHAKNEVLTEVFKLATGRIAALSGTKKYKEAFKRLIQEALGSIKCEDMRLRISKADQLVWESLKEDFPTSITVVLCDNPKGTVVVETEDGSQSIDNSIRTRMEMARGVMRRELIELLFDAEAYGEKGK
jgi:vacuolar-type H+-ATPase subunit E/Vma4